MGVGGGSVLGPGWVGLAFPRNPAHSAGRAGAELGSQSAVSHGCRDSPCCSLTKCFFLEATCSEFNTAGLGEGCTRFQKA